MGIIQDKISNITQLFLGAKVHRGHAGRQVRGGSDPGHGEDVGGVAAPDPHGRAAVYGFRSDHEH